ncbi:MAG: hypothetical protein ACPG5P_09625, partial [Saprospiraceae bacterium]
MRYFIFCLLLFPLGLCNSVIVPLENQEELSFIISNKIKISQENKSIIETLDSFLLSKDNHPYENDYWLASDFDKYQYPYHDLYHIQKKEKIKPELISISNTDEENTKQIKLKYTGIDSSDKVIELMTFNFLVEKLNHEFKFKKILNHNTKNWERHKKGKINYIVSPKRKFKTEDAQKQMEYINSAVEVFEVEIDPITYYSCINPVEIFNIRGYDYCPQMYFAETGGLNETWDNTIFSGNNSERYDHEILHSFTRKKFGRKIHPFLDEGVCTFFGGSNQKPYIYHKSKLKEHLEQNPSFNLMDYLDPYTRLDLNEETSVSYTVG